MCDPKDNCLECDFLDSCRGDSEEKPMVRCSCGSHGEFVGEQCDTCGSIVTTKTMEV
jgi:hypothetical protein